MSTIEDRRKSDRERAKRWRQKKLEGGYRIIQVMLSPEAQKILEQEKNRTGGSTADIVNKALLQLNTAPTAIPVGTAIGREAENTAIKDRVIQMDRDKMPHTKIAQTLNAEGIPTLSGRGKWYQSTIRNLLRQEQEKSS